MDIPQSESIFNLTNENLKFLKIFQTFGFLPFKLKSNEGNFAKRASIGLCLFLMILVPLRCFLVQNEMQFIILFLLDIVTLLADQIYTYKMRNRYIQLFTSIGEIDQKIEKELRMKHKLESLNLSLHKKIKTKWILYSIACFYYPIKLLIMNNLSMQFLDTLFRIISW